MRDAREPWLYLHIAKTAGTSFRYGVPSRELMWHHGGPLDPERFREVPKHIRVVGGHIDYEVLRHIFEPQRVITFLREPVARIVSNYHHVQRHARFHREEVPNDFMEYVRTPHLLNYQCRVLSGLELQEVGFFGLAEHYKESLRRMEKKLRFAPRHRESNRSFAKALVPTPDQRREIEELHAEDMALYARAVELFNT